MRHTLKWSFFIGTAAAGAVLALMKLFQPIRYEHLVLFGYAFVGTSVLAGYVVHKNLEKRNIGKPNNAVKTDGGKMEAQNIAVRRIPINGSGADDMQEKMVEEYFVPASRLLAETNESENNAFDSGDSVAVSKPNTENEAENGRYQPAEKFLDEIEKEEVEIAIQETEGNTAKNNLQPAPSDADSNFLRHCGRRAKILTIGGKIISGKFAGMDTHVVLEDALCDSEKKILLMISKSEIARMEIE
ncbi:MAG: hypothetical protein WA139_02115 [Candidatus Aenigmatarchaeota archaeon]